MKKITFPLPRHYRLLRPEELLRRGDIYTGLTDGVVSKNPSGKAGDWPDFSIYRRRHVKVKKDKPVVQNPNPLVTFYYPTSKEPRISKRRFVRVISADVNHLIGLEVTNDSEGKQKYAFKKFLQYKAEGIRLVEYNPSALKK